MKHEWRKAEKEIYVPKQKPVLVEVPAYKFITLSGQGNPNGELFAKGIEALYGIAYSIRMMPKKGIVPEGYFEYTVYPLEGIWDLDDVGRGLDYLDKDHLVYKIMIRQPEFVTDEVFKQAVELAMKKGNPLTEQVQFEVIEEGLCVQMLHLGSYDDEPETFTQMMTFCEEAGLGRKCLTHREIYLSDARKVEPSKLKTVLRFKVAK